MTHFLAIGGLSPMELIIIALVIVLLFGSTKIPALMRGIGQGISEFKTGIKEGSKPPDESKSEQK